MRRLGPDSIWLGQVLPEDTVYGDRFHDDLQVFFDGERREYELVEQSRIVVKLLPPDYMTLGVHEIAVSTVRDLDEDAPRLSFTVWQELGPWATSVSPDSAPAGSGLLDVVIRGHRFNPAATVVPDQGAFLNAVVVDSTEIRGTVDAAFLANSRLAKLWVQPNTPGYLGTGLVHFTVVPHAPTISAISPDSVDEDGPAFTLTVDGSEFVEGAEVRWNGGSLPTTWVSLTRVTATVGVSRLYDPREVAVTVQNPRPGLTEGGLSNSMALIIHPKLGITELDPAVVPAGSTGFTLRVLGNRFEPEMAITWDGSLRPTTFVSSTELRAEIGAADVAAPAYHRVALVLPPDTATSLSNGDFTVIP